MRQKKKFERLVKFCSNKLTVLTLASPRTSRVAMVSAPTLPKFQAYRLRIYVVYTSYFLRILLSLSYPLPLPLSFFLEFFSILFSIFLEFFLEFFWNFFLYILYMSWIFLEFFPLFLLKLPKIFLPI